MRHISALQAYFQSLVEETVDTSVRAVRGYVHEYLAQRVTEARTKLAQYGERFAAAMTAALEANQQGETCACIPACVLNCLWGHS